MAESEVRYEADGHVRVMTLNRPDKMNALTVDGLAEQSRYLETFRDDDDAWTLVVTGSGRAFSTGLDLSKASQAVGRRDRPPGLNGHNPISLWKPVIAAINGYALGGGLELALACDIRIAADDARLGLPEVKRALIPGTGGCQRLPRIVPMGYAFLMLFTGDWIDAAEAYRIGLVERVVPAAELLEQSVELAQKICQNGPLAVRTVKEAVYRGMDQSLPQALVQDNLLAWRNRQTEDAAEGLAAFREKRPAQYRGS